MKRTRPIKKYFITIPRVAISEPGVYQLKLKISRVIIEKVKELPGAVSSAGPTVHNTTVEVGEGSGQNPDWKYERGEEQVNGEG